MLLQKLLTHKLCKLYLQFYFTLYFMQLMQQYCTLYSEQQKQFCLTCCCSCACINVIMLHLWLYITWWSCQCAQTVSNAKKNTGSCIAARRMHGECPKLLGLLSLHLATGLVWIRYSLCLLLFSGSPGN